MSEYKRGTLIHVPSRVTGKLCAAIKRPCGCTIVFDDEDYIFFCANHAKAKEVIKEKLNE